MYQHKKVTVAVLRLDQLHPVISGNKWFKLQPYLEDAKAFGKKTLLTFGGAFSNHILATAAAGAASGFRTAGVVRGEPPIQPSLTLQEAARYGMQIFFTSREAYREKIIPDDVWRAFSERDTYLVPEGGYGALGAAGARGILASQDTATYTHIVTAVGTGTTLAGLTTAAIPGQTTVGIPVLKNHTNLEAEMLQLVPSMNKNFHILHNFHFGGYAKKNDALIEFMNQWFLDTGIPSDFVYTGKMFFAAEQLITADFFPEGSSILLLHTGGLQGNRSLPKGTLIF